MVRLLLVVTVLASCRSPKPARDPSENSLIADDPDRQVCEPAQVTGTMITRTVCRSASEKAAEKQAAQNFMTQPHSNQTSFPDPPSLGHR